MGLSCSAALSLVGQGIGGFVVARSIYSLASFGYKCFLRPGKKLQQYGEWAIVTGATDGIGLAIAKKISKQGLKVILVSRNEEKLVQTKNDLVAALKKTDADFETLAIDFSGEFTEAKKNAVRTAIKDKDLGVLVNNVGISYEHAEFFHDISPERVDQLIRLNIDSTTWMTYICLPQMLEKKKGCVVNISSGLGLFSCPLYAEYSAAKDYIVRLTHSLYGEYSSKGIDFQVQLPAFVCSKMSKIRKPSVTTPSPDGYAAASVKAMGYDREIAPYWSHYLLLGTVKSLPVSFQDALCRSMHLPIRAKALKKKKEVEGKKD